MNKIVKDFEYPESFGFSGSAGKTMVKGYARGGSVKKAAASAVHRHEAAMHPGKAQTKLCSGGKVRYKK